MVRPTVIPKSLKPKMISYKSLMLSLQILVQTCNNGQQIARAMIQATTNTCKKISRNKQCQLLINIKNSGIATNDIEYSLKRLNLSDHANPILSLGILGGILYLLLSMH